jgi:hypothetical protein
MRVSKGEVTERAAATGPDAAAGNTSSGSMWPETGQTPQSSAGTTAEVGPIARTD